MAQFSNPVLTQKGQILYTKMLAGATANFTKIKLGSGQLTQGQDPQTFTTLIDYKFDAQITSITENTQLKNAIISSIVTNSAITTATYICELGLYAQDPDEGEILYAYANAGTKGDYYPPNTDGSFSWSYQLNASIGNASNITVNVSQSTYDHAVSISDSTLAVISGSNQKEINKNIDNTLINHASQLAEKASNIDNNRTTTNKSVTGAINELNINKADKTYVDNQDVLKRDKSILLTMDDLAQDVKTAFTGGSVAVVGKRSVAFQNMTSDIEQLLGSWDIVDILGCITKDYYYATDGQHAASRFMYVKLNVNEGEVYKITCCGNNIFPPYMVFNSTNSAIYTRTVTQNTYLTDEIYIIPANASYIVLNNTLPNPFKIEKLNQLSTNNDTAIKYSDVIYTAQIGLFIDGNPVLNTGFTQYLAAEISVIKGEIYHIKGLIEGSNGGSFYPVHLWTNDNKWYSIVGTLATYGAYDVTIKINADGFLRVSSRYIKPIIQKGTTYTLKDYTDGNNFINYYKDVPNLTITEGLYLSNVLNTAFKGYYSTTFYAEPGANYYVKGLLAGSAHRLVTGDLGSSNSGSNSYVYEDEYYFTGGVVGGNVYISSFLNNPIIRKFQSLNPNDVITDLGIDKNKVAIITDYFKPNYWQGKTMVWFGTSIPSSGGYHGGYPNFVAKKLGMKVSNESVASSCARAGNWNAVNADDPLGYSGMIFDNLMRSLSLSSAEKQAINDNWSKWQPLIHNAPTTIASSDLTNYKSYSYDMKLDKYLVDGNCPDLFVFDHGHNDSAYSFVSAAGDQWSEEMKTIPTNPTDRTYFIGAMNFLIQRILNYNPRARIVFIGHYENDRKINISLAQQVLADYWDYPLCKLWEKLGWSQKTVTTTGYWTGTGSSSVWTPNGGTQQTLTLTKVWLQDDLHPFSQGASDLISNELAEFIKTIR